MELQNIVIISDCAHINGGAANVAITSAINLAKNGNKVYFFAGMGPIDPALIENNIEVICLNQRDILSEPSRTKAVVQGLWNFKAQKSLNKLLKTLDNSTTIIHCHVWCKTLSASIFQPIRKLKFKTIITLHDYFTLCPVGGFYNYQTKEICKLKPQSFQCLKCNCDARSYQQKVWRNMRIMIQNKTLYKVENLYAFSISSFSKKIIAPYLNQRVKEIIDVTNPVELNNGEIIDIESNEYYLYLARIEEDKGINLFCEAISNLNLKGIVVGDGYLREPLKKKYPNIIFTGWLSGNDKQSYIAKSKCLVLTSLGYETFGLVVAEMKSFGIPSIVPEPSAASDQVIDKYDGLIYKSGNISSLQSVLLEFEKMNLKEIQNNILKNFDKNIYTNQTHIRTLLKNYKYVINNNIS